MIIHWIGIFVVGVLHVGPDLRREKERHHGVRLLEVCLLVSGVSLSGICLFDVSRDDALSPPV